jgi:ribosomal protein S12 methylthiotransferase
LKNRRTVSLVSLGCPKNLVDSEGLVSTLLSNDFRVVTEPKESEVVIVNTCGFLDASRKESLDVIKGAVALKRTAGVKGVLVAGCMVGNYRSLLEAEAPGVDRLVGFDDYGRIDRIVDGLFPADAAPTFHVERRRMDVSLTPGHYAYLKISEGCNHTCSFCVIPSIRGKMTSVPTEELVLRAKGLAARGVKELVLIAQDSTLYGADLYGEVRLDRLLKRLDAIEGIRWIRLMYAYPTEVKGPLIDAMAASSKVVPYLDVPIQHANDRVLKRMLRAYGRSLLEDMVGALRDRIPGVALRTTVIAGFPGETDAEFADLADFLKRAEFDRLGCFTYSQEEGSAASALGAQVPEDVKAARRDLLMKQQQEIAFRKTAAKVGTTFEVLIDAAAENGRPARARAPFDAPEVDCNVLLDDATAKAGDLVRVLATAAEGYDLRARRA